MVVIVVIMIVVVIVAVIVTVAVPVIVAVVMMRPEQHRRDEVDEQADHGDRQRVLVVHRRPVDEVLDAFRAHPDRDDPEHDGAREPGERVDLAGAEAERVVARVLRAYQYATSVSPSAPT